MFFFPSYVGKTVACQSFNGQSQISRGWHLQMKSLPLIWIIAKEVKTLSLIIG